MIPVIFNPYPDASEIFEEALEHAILAAKRLRHLNLCLKSSDDTQRLRGWTGQGCDSLKGCILLREKGGAHTTLSALLPHLRTEKEKYEAILWLLTFFSRGQILAEAPLKPYEETLLKGSELPVPLLGYAAAQGGIVSTVSPDDDWQQEFFYLKNPDGKILNVSSASCPESLEKWAHDWFQGNLNFIEYLQVKFGATFCNGALNNMPMHEFYKGIYEAFKKAERQLYSCDDSLIKIVKTEKSVNLLELRVYGDGVRIFFQLRNGKPHIAGFYTKGQAISQNKAIQQAGKRLWLEQRNNINSL